MYPNAYNVYKSNSVNYASKEQLLLMLVEGAVKFAKIGRQAMVDKDIEKANSSLIRTQDIFTELMVSLDTTQGEWTKQMLSIYEFIKRQLVQANLKKDVKIMDEIIPLIEDVSNLWHDAYKEAKRQG
ncbi:flagellar export chaperone FliS [Clostridium saccharoperbutylacetonicum]|jgi:flagellar protein FliS|uniref:Flagellar secretion chaperone FliS n=1 Tax=Clostridium saccharoperbutylacetonicum N1-4(HMT) TaxID=931276 RepID=M1N4G3_9CLOT|nr:flagellar export chaperone FliS [Clostridium saccharoperbutylacetonicum]AGF58327.1 flagellar assembly protein FliS [Clostridium saccharoperbutylacetonicum N1-4(HMT)]AQR97021.1 flagellar protein FliS [Clostridium saccharoperbutylacetonicum]NRT60896.1 flagellar protein FliS [Clostridium saccharoperbutylacetonicum]NSB24209.1 flagellar protein FliS [Clostridium saccharoperbutylacetonicum]NSB43587.1 flagellar protein FliS [Clostridium saccharoperbutylacetonicum]